MKRLYEDVFKHINSCLRRDGIPLAMTPLFGVQTVFKTVSKHYKSAVNSF